MSEHAATLQVLFRGSLYSITDETFKGADKKNILQSFFSLTALHNEVVLEDKD